MPLIIAVLAILVVGVGVKEHNKNDIKESAIHAKDSRKTNAVLEQLVLDAYMKHGYSFEDAFCKSYEDMLAAGYEPCIPREAYSKNSDWLQASYCGYGCFEPEKFDSAWVKSRREAAENEWKRAHPGVHINEAPPEEIERMTYDNFPETESEYVHDVQRSATKASAVPVGSFIIYPILGTCEVLAHNWIGDGSQGGTYTLRILKTGKIITFIKIGAPRITLQGK